MAATAPNYQANDTISRGWGAPLLNTLLHPEVLEDVSRFGFGGTFLQPQIVNDLNRRVSSGAITQDAANAEWAGLRENEAEAARSRETSSRQFQQRGLTMVGSMALGGYLGGLGEGTDALSMGATAEGEGGNAAYYGSGGGSTGSTASGALGASEIANWNPWGGFGPGANVGTGSSMFTLGNAGTALGLASSSYGLYLSEQARRERQKQLMRQREYQDRLNQLMANPSSVTSLPGYQFRADQGSQAVARRMASLGYGSGSGNLGTALTKYGQDYATGELERQEGLLAQLYGMSGPNINARDPYEMASRSLGSLGYGVGRLNG